MFTGGPTSECEAPTQRRPAPRARLALPCTAGLTRARGARKQHSPVGLSLPFLHAFPSSTGTHRHGEHETEALPGTRLQGAPRRARRAAQLEASRAAWNPAALELAPPSAKPAPAPAYGPMIRRGNAPQRAESAAPRPTAAALPARPASVARTAPWCISSRRRGGGQSHFTFPLSSPPTARQPSAAPHAGRGGDAVCRARKAHPLARRRRYDRAGRFLQIPPAARRARFAARKRRLPAESGVRPRAGLLGDETGATGADARAWSERE